MRKIIGYIIAIIGSLSYLIGCSHTVQLKEEMIPIEATWTLTQNTGVDIVELNYASEDRVIFHGYFGLFVYDLNTERITHSLDLKSIRCHFTQGDAYCEVSVSQKGNIVQLHPMNSDEMYVYDIEKNTLKQMKYEPMEDGFKITPNDNPGEDISHETVKFSNGDVGYLQYTDTTLNGLYYIVGDKQYKLFGEK